jgi:hypothetical protein
MKKSKLELIVEEFSAITIENASTLKEQITEMERKIAEDDRRREENERILNEKFAETERFFKETRREIAGITKSNGEIAEEYFANSFLKDLHFAGQEFDSLAANMNKKMKKINLQGEFDLVLFNCTSIAIIEVKYKAEKKHIEKLLNKPQIFKQLFPEYANFNIFLGLAGLSMKPEVESEAIEQGIAVVKQLGENMVVFDKHLKMF